MKSPEAEGTPISFPCARVDRAAEHQDWIAAYARAAALDPSGAAAGALPVLLEDHDDKDQNGVWMVTADGNHYREGGRPDYVACILTGKYDRPSDHPLGEHQEQKTWCGRDVPSSEWTFINASHAAVNAKNEGRLLSCADCVASICTTLQAHTWTRPTLSPEEQERAQAAAELREGCVDRRLVSVLRPFGFFPGDYVEVDEHGLTAYRKTGFGVETHPLGDVYDAPAVRDACDRWFGLLASLWVERARWFAREAHGDQRYGTEPYSVHLDEVYAVLDGLGFGSDPIGIAGLLHDVIEDTKTDRKVLEALFGFEIAELVEAVSKEKGPRAATVAASNAKIAEACRVRGDDKPATLKLADRICNVRRSRQNRPDLFALYLAEQPAFSAALEEEGLGDPRLWVMLAEAFGS